MTAKEGQAVFFHARPHSIEPSQAFPALALRVHPDGPIDLVVHDRLGRPAEWKRVPRKSEQNTVDCRSPMNEHEVDKHTTIVEQLRGHAGALRRIQGT
jgi:hypothetical protein